MTRPALRRILLVSGRVQGVGFRPYVYRLATAHLLGGWVRNDARGVTICLEGPAEAADRFCAELVAHPPALARVDGCETLEEAPIRDWSARFEIEASDTGPGRGALVQPDAHVCADCVRELFDPQDRRYRHPLISCTHCGPRYSIIRGAPYDRSRTTMAPFAMCAACEAEYRDPADRRFHAQPIGCWSCGPQVALRGPDGAPAEAADPVRAAAALLRDGRILAVKALGGYQIMADPANADTVARLRRVKERSARPFALLARDVAAVEQHAILDDQERRLLESPGRPIVLVRARPANALSPDIAPRSPALGFMLPATPLQHLLAAEGGGVLIATSGNRPDEPMARTEAEALRDLAGVVDGFLVHDREIHARVDDSIARVVHSAVAPAVTFLRRARGYAPDPIPAPFPVPPVLALGAELKSTICLGQGRALHPSQHLGDLTTPGAQDAFAHAIDHLRELLGIEPQLIAHDLHPDFHSTRRAAGFPGAALVGVQHHHAHLAACMADNGLDRPVIGVIFDGAGLGTDGTLWGGEFLVGDYARVERRGHLARLRLPGGDRATREPARIAIALLVQHLGRAALELPLAILRDRDARELAVIADLAERGLHAPETSSVGRLFDAVSALLGVCARAGYEGQAAIELEHLLGGDLAPAPPWPLHLARRDGQLVIEHEPWLRALLGDLIERRLPPAQISRRFHESVVLAVTEACAALARETGLADVALSGGVFQNQHLAIRAEQELTRAGLRVHMHRRVPPNDGGIAIGQALVAAARSRTGLAAGP